MSGRASLAAYGLLGLPLAMAALPVYVQIPAYYANQLGLPLATTGWVLFLARLIDTVQDPWLGRVIDRQTRRGRLRGLMLTAGLVLALSFAGLWLPPVQGMALAAWLALMLVLIYTAHSTINIAYLAWGARMPAAMLTRAAAWREGAGLIGVIAASVLPLWLMHAAQWPVRTGLGVYALLFAGVLLAGLTALRCAPRWAGQAEPTSGGWRELLSNHAFRRLLLPYFLNALAVSIPATLVLFFIEDRIGAPQQAGFFLGAYFLAGAAGLPLWTALARRWGAAHAWRIGMVGAMAAFVWAALLGPGDSAAYFAVCLVSGLMLGADLTLPPVLLAERIPLAHPPAAYVGIWSLLGKLALALSGLSLPLLAVFDYRPGQGGGAALALAYAGLPCLMKLFALLALRRLPTLTAGEGT